MSLKTIDFAIRFRQGGYIFSHLFPPAAGSSRFLAECGRTSPSPDMLSYA